MANARGSVFLFVFMAIGIMGMVTVAAFMAENNKMSTGSVANDATIYLSNTSAVNASTQFAANVSTAGAQLTSPLPLLMAILAIGAACLLFLLVVKKR